MEILLNLKVNALCEIVANGVERASESTDKKITEKQEIGLVSFFGAAQEEYRRWDCFRGQMKSVLDFN